ncbi:low affinity potassium transporter [Agyrium rufum]|nr:low affinity potassium transporter [Agyrium rufum]
MVFGPFLDAAQWVKGMWPGSPFKKRHWSFLTIHYVYLGSLVIIGSILIYPAGVVAYIDALFFASGAATQSGLNSVDFNLIHTYQQVIVYFIAMVANPIFINTFVVFVRLYWFEKRFQNVVEEARNFRRTRSRSHFATQGPEEEEKQVGTDDQGVNGRTIVVLHKDPNSDGEPTEVVLPRHASQDGQADGSASGSSGPRKGSSQESKDRSRDTSSQRPSFHRDITFADEVDRGMLASPLRVPQQLSAEQQIAFLENQRHPKDTDTFRIPGPREWDRGGGPEMITEGQEKNEFPFGSPIETRQFGAFPSRVSHDTKRSGEGREVKRSITSEGWVPPRLKDLASPLSFFSPRKIASAHEPNGKERHATFERQPSNLRQRPRSGTWGSLRQSSSQGRGPLPYLSYQPTIGRNSAFVDLTEEQREELGGIEYRSLKTLAIILVSYFLFWHVLGVIVLVPWIQRSGTWGPVVTGDGQNRVWWGFFTSATLFNDLGYTLTPDSMISFQLAIIPLILGSFLIVIGNTGFPCMLRFTIWCLQRLVPPGSGIHEELSFLLDHPRRCFTLLFPSSATWWLFWILVLLNGLDIIFFIVLDLNDPTVTSINPPGYRVLNGIFQAASTRTAGLAVVNLANLHPAIQVSYLIMMYISVFPIAISVRRTNVYEEKSLGIYSSRQEEDEDDKEPSYVGAHLRRQLSFDLWYIFLGLFVIAIAEGSRIQDPNQIAFNLFSVLFEIVSAYGTVGLSLGYPNINASFSAEFSVVSKLVIIAMQIRGRHRGLPYDLDRAIMLPSESLHRKEDEDAARRVTTSSSALQARRNSTASGMTSGMAPFGSAGGSVARQESGGNILRRFSSVTGFQKRDAGYMQNGAASGDNQMVGPLNEKTNFDGDEEEPDRDENAIVRESESSAEEKLQAAESRAATLAIAESGSTHRTKRINTRKHLGSLMSSLTTRPKIG